MTGIFSIIMLSTLLGASAVVEADEAPDADIELEPAHVVVNLWRFHIPPPNRQGVPGTVRTAIFSCPCFAFRTTHPKS